MPPTSEQAMIWPKLLPLIQFRAEASPLGKAISLIWDIPLNSDFGDALPPAPGPDAVPLFILRRQQRFPGLNRRGMIPQRKQLLQLFPGVTPEDRTNLEDVFLTGAEDGFVVYDTQTFGFDLGASGDSEKVREEWFGDRLITTRNQFRDSSAPPLAPPSQEVITRRIRDQRQPLTPNTPPVLTRRTVEFIDREGIQPGIVYYYTAFVGPDNDNRWFSQATQASALATGQHGYDLFRLLPQIHQIKDRDTFPLPNTVAEEDRYKGQFQRFLDTFSSHANLLHGLNQGLRDLHNTQRADSRFLPHLAHLIGWQLRADQNEQEQRNDISTALERYRIVGTVPIIQSIINQLTGWESQVHEFSQNVLLSFDIKRLEQQGEETIYLNGNLQPTSEYLAYLDASENLDEGDVLSPFEGDRWSERRLVPAGSLNFDDPEVLFKLRSKAIDDPNVYSYEVVPLPEKLNRRRIPSSDILYNSETIGIYIEPDIISETFSPENTAERIRQILLQFLPLQVRPIFFINILEGESYDTLENVVEEIVEDNLTLNEILVGGLTDSGLDQIQEWQLLVSFIPDLPNAASSNSVDFTIESVDSNIRTWHSALQFNALDSLRGDEP